MIVRRRIVKEEFPKWKVFFAKTLFTQPRDHIRAWN